MTAHKKDQFKKIIEVLTVITMTVGLVYGGVAWGWNNICVPKYQAEIKKAIDEQETIENQMFQKLLDISIENRDRLSRIEGKLEK